MRARDLSGFGPVGTDGAKPVDVLGVMRRLRARSLGHLSADEYEEAARASAAVTDLIYRADNALRAIDNLIAADQVPVGYKQYADDLRAALARIGGGA